MQWGGSIPMMAVVPETILGDPDNIGSPENTDGAVS